MNRIHAELRYWRTTLGYRVRPYDMVADRRRWWWQRPSPCGRAVFAGMTGEQRASIEAWVHQHLKRAPAEPAAPEHDTESDDVKES